MSGFPATPRLPEAEPEIRAARERRGLALDKELGDSCATRGAHAAALLHYDACLAREIPAELELAVRCNRALSRNAMRDWAGAARDAALAVYGPALRGARFAAPLVALKAALRLSDAYREAGETFEAKAAMQARTRPTRSWPASADRTGASTGASTPSPTSRRGPSPTRSPSGCVRDA